jgi:hypothetical protein
LGFWADKSFRGRAFERGVEVHSGHPPRLLDGRAAARHRHRSEMADPLERPPVGKHELAAPDRAVGPVSKAVEGDPDHGCVDSVVRQAGHDVRVVMLHADQVDADEFHRVLGGEIFRVQIVRHHLRLDVEQFGEMLDAGGERAQRLVVLQIPDVLRQERVVLLQQAECVLQFGSAGQHRTVGPPCQAHGLRHVTTRPPDHARRPDHRVVGTDVDRAIVGEERVRDVLEPFERVVVLVRDRLVRDVPAREHDRRTDRFEQQVVKRCVREHDPEMTVAWCDGRRELSALG